MQSEKSQIKRCPFVWKKPLMVATPTLGVVRFEWCHARYGQIIPVNWDMTGFDISYATIGYSIDDAYNLICKKFLETRSQWLLIIEDDVLIPPDCFLKMAGYINDGKIPIVSGLYYTKANPSEPLIFRGRGNGVFSGWEFGDKVWCDGVPMGCILIHGSILKTLWDNSVRYTLPDGEKTNKVFETPRNMEFNPSTWVFKSQQGTQDLFFCDRIIKENVIEKCGFKVKSKKNPFLVDTSLFCKHIDMGTGKQFPPFTIYKAEKNGNT